MKCTDLIFFVGGVHLEEKCLLESGCDDCVGVGSVTEVMDDHADYIDDPRWSKYKKRTVQIDRHIFYR